MLETTTAPTWFLSCLTLLIIFCLVMAVFKVTGISDKLVNRPEPKTKPPTSRPGILEVPPPPPGRTHADNWAEYLAHKAYEDCIPAQSNKFPTTIKTGKLRTKCIACGQWGDEETQCVYCGHPL